MARDRDASMAHGGSVVRSRPTFCRICEAACGLRVDLDTSGEPVRIRPDRAHPVSRGFACAKGTRFLEMVKHHDRLLHPLRQCPDGGYQQISWHEALTFAADCLQPLLDRYGSYAVGIYSGNPLAFRERPHGRVSS